jgi:hypothetical protein
VNTLPSLTNFIVTTLQLLPLCQQVRVVSTNAFSAQQFAVKVRAILAEGNLLQVYVYHNNEHTDYAYQLAYDDKPILRWDNKEHFPTIATQPHHFHTNQGNVTDSPLTGDPSHDLPFVLDYLTKFLRPL